MDKTSGAASMPTTDRYLALAVMPALLVFGCSRAEDPPTSPRVATESCLIEKVAVERLEADVVAEDFDEELCYIECSASAAEIFLIVQVIKVDGQQLANLIMPLRRETLDSTYRSMHSSIACGGGGGCGTFYGIRKSSASEITVDLSMYWTLRNLKKGALSEQLPIKIGEYSGKVLDDGVYIRWAFDASSNDRRSVDE